jgi:hypothetical protein
MMHKNLIYPLLMVSTFTVIGCEKKAAPSQTETMQAPTANSPQPTKSLEERITNLESSNHFLQFEIDAINSRPAFVSSEEKAYGTASTQFGSFPVVIKNVVPYLDGYKVTIAIGNITTATFVGCKFSVGWGMHTKQFDVTNAFYPGRYTNVQISLTPAKPEDVKIINVGLVFDKIQLLQ